MRSLIEWRAGIVGITEGKAVTENSLSEIRKTFNEDSEQFKSALTIAKLFGISADSESSIALKIGPTRLSFWDCNLDDEWYKSEGREISSEVKAETAVNRITGTAQNGSLRFIERVPAGALFDFKLSFKELDIDADLLDTILQGLKLLELDAIGGSGSRGYGKIKFVKLKLNEESIAEQFEKTDPFA
jgi:CRISPR-associated protein Csm3